MMARSKQLKLNIITAFTAALLLVFCIPLPVRAAIQLQTLPGLPYAVNNGNFVAWNAEGQLDLPSTAAVNEEITHLSTMVPGVSRQNWTVSIVDTGCQFPGTGDIGGLAVKRSNGDIFIFAHKSYNSRSIRTIADPQNPYMTKKVAYRDAVARFVTAHEMGHLVRFYLIPDDQFKSYLASRGWKAEYGNDEELFAEDFRFLFGSQEANIIGHRFAGKGISLPGPAEREFILRCTGQ